MEETLILPWVQDKKDHTMWFVPFSQAELQSRPLLVVQFLPVIPLSQNNWRITVLNLFIIPFEATIWDVEKVKAHAEELYIATVSELSETVENISTAS